MSLSQRLPRPTKIYHATTYSRIAQHHGFDGRGKTILVTGGAAGIGFSICQAFAEAGVARIAILSRSLGPLERAKAELEAAYPSTEVLTFACTTTDRARVKEALRDIGLIHVLVNCAAIAHRRAKATELDAEEMQDTFDVNVMGTFNVVQSYLNSSPQPAVGGKTVITVSSAAGQVRSPFRAGYGPSKAAVTQMMEHFALEQAAERDDVRIFSFHPGACYTPGTSKLFSKDAMIWEDVKLPAHFTLWLAGPESSFLNGRYLWANWDVDELIALKPRLAEDPTFMTIGLIL